MSILATIKGRRKEWREGGREGGKEGRREGGKEGRGEGMEGHFDRCVRSRCVARLNDRRYRYQEGVLIGCIKRGCC